MCICSLWEEGGRQSRKQFCSLWADSNDRLKELQHMVCSAGILGASAVFVAGHFSCVLELKKTMQIGVKLPYRVCEGELCPVLSRRLCLCSASPGCHQHGTWHLQDTEELPVLSVSPWSCVPPADTSVTSARVSWHVHSEGGSVPTALRRQRGCSLLAISVLRVLASSVVKPAKSCVAVSTANLNGLHLIWLK